MSVPKILDRKSTRLNSSHANISYDVFCLKKDSALIGGFLNAIAESLLLWFNRRLAGGSCCLSGLLRTARGESRWLALFFGVFFCGMAGLHPLHPLFPHAPLVF